MRVEQYSLDKANRLLQEFVTSGMRWLVPSVSGWRLVEELWCLHLRGLLGQIDHWRWRHLNHFKTSGNSHPSAWHHITKSLKSSATPLWKARISHCPVVSWRIWSKSFGWFPLLWILFTLQRRWNLNFNYCPGRRVWTFIIGLPLNAFTADNAQRTAACKELKVPTVHPSWHWNVKFSVTMTLKIEMCRRNLHMQ
jgi:hypothetical protein